MEGIQVFVFQDWANNNSTVPSINLLKLMKKCEKITKPTLVAGTAFELIFEPEVTNNLFKDGHFNVYGIAPNVSKDGINYQKLIKFFEILALNQFVYKFAVEGRRGRWGPLGAV